MAATSMVEMELAFRDDTTKKIQIGPFTPAALANVKANIKALNASGNTYWEEMIVNENGSRINVGTDYPTNTPIRNVTIVTSTETEVNLYEG